MRNETIDFVTKTNFKYSDLEGEKIFNSNSKLLISKSNEDELKYWGLALSLSEGLNLNKTAKQNIKGLIKADKDITVLLKKQLLSLVK